MVNGNYQPDEPKHRFRLPRIDNWRSTLNTVMLILLAPAIALFISAFVLQSYQVDGQSMETTLQDGDRLIVNKLPRSLARITGHPYTPRRGDIIIFNQSGAAYGFIEPKQLIKRVVGLPQERVVVKDGQITVFNKERPEGFNPDISGAYQVPAKTTPGNVDVTLGPSEVFVFGDNRNNSEDSRIFGPVNERNIVGKLSLRLFPLGKPHRP